MESVQAGLVGLGWWGAKLLEGTHAASTITVGTCHARNPQARATFAAEHGLRPVGSFEEMLADPDVEALIIATPHSTHAELVLAACEAGKHVFVEKPFVMRMADGRRCVEAAEHAGVVLQVGHQRRRQPANRRIRAMIDEGALGDVVALEGNYSSPGKGRGDSDNWRQDPSERPLSGLTPFGVHVIDTFHSLVGPIGRVAAIGAGPVGDSRLDAAAILTFEFESGAIGTLVTSTSLPATNRVGVLGTEAAVWNDLDGRRLLVQSRADQAPREEAAEQLDTLADQMGEFARCVRTGERPEVDGWTGLRVVAVLEAALASRELGVSVQVEEF